jgi:hypothetical protein
VLARRRTAAVLAAAGTAILLLDSAGVPMARALPAGHATRGPVSSLPASAKGRLVRELIKAWQITKGDGVTVAVLSTGVDQVSNLAGKLRHGPDFAPFAGAPAADGTVLSSLIAGSGPTSANPFGAIGIAPGAKILAEQIVDYNAGRGAARYERPGTWQHIMAKAIRYAVIHGASVIATFESGYSDTPELDNAVSYAVSKKVVVLGQDYVWGSSPNDPMYPDSLPGVINFSGTTLKGLRKPVKRVRQPVNSSVLVTAPDNVEYTTGPGNNQYFAYGNFPTIAWMAGTVALIKSVYPQITPAQVARALAVSASFHPAGGYNTRIGFGLINPLGALHAAGALVKLRGTASPGPGLVSGNARFGRGKLGAVAAIQHSPVMLSGYGAAILAGLAMLTLAVRLARRRRRVPDSGGSDTVATVQGPGT